MNKKYKWGEKSKEIRRLLLLKMPHRQIAKLVPCSLGTISKQVKANPQKFARKTIWPCPTCGKRWAREAEFFEDLEK